MKIVKATLYWTIMVLSVPVIVVALAYTLGVTVAEQVARWICK